MGRDPLAREAGEGGGRRPSGEGEATRAGHILLYGPCNDGGVEVPGADVHVVERYGHGGRFVARAPSAASRRRLLCDFLRAPGDPIKMTPEFEDMVNNP